ncbi:hypothetical protein ACIF6L_37920 [Kitasatospora sp. NPDC086009]|uniref:hypothetical protein n=1 Tax=unclassified Kitasatospora TaxID=2633591 RepID=UPI0037CBD17C
MVEPLPTAWKQERVSRSATREPTDADRALAAAVDPRMTTPAMAPEPAARAAFHFADVPIYSPLAASWWVSGRTVPGQPDPVCEMLVGGPGRRRAIPTARESLTRDARIR